MSGPFVPYGVVWTFRTLQGHVPHVVSECFHRACTVSRTIAQLHPLPYLQGVIFANMDDELIKKLRSEFARQGGKARAKALTAKERRDSAIKASKAAAKVRQQKAQGRKAHG